MSDLLNGKLHVDAQGRLRRMPSGRVIASGVTVHPNAPKRGDDYDSGAAIPEGDVLPPPAPTPITTDAVEEGEEQASQGLGEDGEDRGKEDGRDEEGEEDGGGSVEDGVEDVPATPSKRTRNGN